MRVKKQYRFLAVPAWSASTLVRRQLHEALLACATNGAGVARALLHRNASKKDRGKSELAGILVEDVDKVAARLERTVGGLDRVGKRRDLQVGNFHRRGVPAPASHSAV
jgi:hypothetical protein